MIQVSKHKVQLVDLSDKRTYRCKIQKLKGTKFSDVLILKTEESFEATSRKDKDTQQVYKKD